MGRLVGVAYRLCPTCDGDGYEVHRFAGALVTSPCPTCKATGLVRAWRLSRGEVGMLVLVGGGVLAVLAWRVVGW